VALFCSLSAFSLFKTGVTTFVISGKDVLRKEKQQQDEDEKDVEEATNEPEPEPEDGPEVEKPEQPRGTEETNVEDEPAKESGHDEFECYESSKITDAEQ
jgi:hypothetical protein